MVYFMNVMAMTLYSLTPSWTKTKHPCKTQKKISSLMILADYWKMDGLLTSLWNA